jgi:DNA-binding GntR family transcriptional regulator
MSLGTVRPMIDRDSHIPPWQQLAAILRERIRTGQITVRLPGERSLQQEFGLALITVRKAVRKLADDGLVVTTPGMGTYVVKRDPPPEGDAPGD